MRRFLTWLIVLTASLALPVSSDGGLLKERLGPLVPKDAQWAVSVIDMKTGIEIMNTGDFKGVNPPHLNPLPPSTGSGQAGEGRTKSGPLVPGSLMKLFVAGAILDYEEYGCKEPPSPPKDPACAKRTTGPATGLDMTTTISHDGIIRGDTLSGNLYIKGRGNALLSARDLKAVVEELMMDGITGITGSVIADDTLFDTRGLTRKRTGPAYAPPGALGLDLHTTAVYVNPTEPGKAPEVWLDPPNSGARFSISARTVRYGSSTIEITRLSDTSYKVTGNIPVATGSKGALKKRFAVEDPALYAAQTLRTLLANAGINVSNEATKGATPGSAEIVTEIKGPKLERLVRDMNIKSLNVVADNLFLLLGEAVYGAPGTPGTPGTVENGRRAIEEFLKDLLSVKDGPAGVVIVDGSGLAEGNRVAPDFMARYLYGVSKTVWFEKFRAGLVDHSNDNSNGNGKGVGKGAFKSFAVKTGGLPDVSALAGYGVDGLGRAIAFSWILNTPGAGVSGMARTGDEVMRTLSSEVLR